MDWNKKATGIQSLSNHKLRFAKEIIYLYFGDKYRYIRLLIYCGGFFIIFYNFFSFIFCLMAFYWFL